MVDHEYFSDDIASKIKPEVIFRLDDKLLPVHIHLAPYQNMICFFVILKGLIIVEKVIISCR